ncbi:helix-turn-helix domain-containing protein [Gordonia sp. (in: high G+C Gram-positive bacteria)]|uniref:helix-turn-helix domain-containing protein n=1 Tax=Gordonia sp. (in: high G+C Gram-positive bacteria) TaxID=84139 RepID=UPI003F97DD7B
MTPLNHVLNRHPMNRPSSEVARDVDAGPHLTPRIVAAWEARLGVDRQRRVRPSHFAGASGMREWWGGVDIIANDPDSFRAVRFDRELSMTSAFCSVHSAVRAERTTELVNAVPFETLLVTVTSMRGRTAIHQCGREYEYAASDLAFIAATRPFVQTVSAVSDPSGLAIPLALLGKHRCLAEQPRRPITKRTPLARAAAGFVRRFAADAAASDAPPPSSDAELAAIDLVTAALSELISGDTYRLQDDVLFNQQAALDLIARRHRDAGFTPDAIAAELHLSRRQLYRLFEDADQSLATTIADARVQTACEILVANPWLPVGNVAAASGFRSVATFRNRFKARFGLGPVEYRQRIVVGSVS